VHEGVQEGQDADLINSINSLIVSIRLGISTLTPNSAAFGGGATPLEPDV